jgi:hypothetical protein
VGQGSAIRQQIRRVPGFATLVAFLVVWFAGGAYASTVGYWRMEVDNDLSAAGLSVPNELAFGTPFVSSEAQLDGVNLPTTIVPITFQSNQFSLSSFNQGGAAGINGSAAWYTELAVTSVTVEYWARTVESTATPFSWTTGGLDGIVIANPNSIDVTWHVDVGGTPMAYSLTNLTNMDANWHHYAFSYDEVDGLASFFLDGVLVQNFDGPDGAPLVLAAGTPIEAGVLMDYASAGQGTLDELKIDGSVLDIDEFLLTPEPGTAVLLGLGLLLLVARSRRF